MAHKYMVEPQAMDTVGQCIEAELGSFIRNCKDIPDTSTILYFPGLMGNIASTYIGCIASFIGFEAVSWRFDADNHIFLIKKSFFKGADSSTRFFQNFSKVGSAMEPSALMELSYRLGFNGIVNDDVFPPLRSGDFWKELTIPVNQSDDESSVADSVNSEPNMIDAPEMQYKPFPICDLDTPSCSYDYKLARPSISSMEISNKGKTSENNPSLKKKHDAPDRGDSTNIKMETDQHQDYSIPKYLNLTSKHSRKRNIYGHTLDNMIQLEPYEIEYGSYMYMNRSVDTKHDSKQVTFNTPKRMKKSCTKGSSLCVEADDISTYDDINDVVSSIECLNINMDADYEFDNSHPKRKRSSIDYVANVPGLAVIEPEGTVNMDPRLINLISACIDKPLIIYAVLNYTKPLEQLHLKMQEMIEIYNIPTDFGIPEIFEVYMEEPRYVLKCDENHAILITSSSNHATRALRVQHEQIRSRPISEASELAKLILCKHRIEPVS